MKNQEFTKAEIDKSWKAAKAMARRAFKEQGQDPKDTTVFEAYWDKNKDYFAVLSRVALREFLK